MAVREQVSLNTSPWNPTNFYGLVQQKGPWPNQKIDDMKRAPQPLPAGVVGRGGTLHAGHNFWKLDTTYMHDMHTLGNTGSIKYTSPGLIGGPISTGGGAVLQKGRQKRESKLISVLEPYLERISEFLGTRDTVFPGGEGTKQEVKQEVQQVIKQEPAVAPTPQSFPETVPNTDYSQINVTEPSVDIGEVESFAGPPPPPPPPQRVPRYASTPTPSQVEVESFAGPPPPPPPTQRVPWNASTPTPSQVTQSYIPVEAALVSARGNLRKGKGSGRIHKPKGKGLLASLQERANRANEGIVNDSEMAPASSEWDEPPTPIYNTTPAGPHGIPVVTRSSGRITRPPARFINETSMALADQQKRAERRRRPERNAERKAEEQAAGDSLKAALSNRRQAVNEDADGKMSTPDVVAEMFEKIADRVKVEEGYKPVTLDTSMEPHIRGLYPFTQLVPERKRKRSLADEKNRTFNPILSREVKKETPVKKERPVKEKQNRKKTTEVERLKESSGPKPTNTTRRMGPLPPPPPPPPLTAQGSMTRRQTELERLKASAGPAPKRSKRRG